MTIKAQEHFAEVATLTTDTDEWVVPTGEVWRIRSFQGSAAYVEDTSAQLVWDYGVTDVLIRSTHGDAAFGLDFEITGDGAKILAIVLDNQSANSQALGGSYEAKKS